MWVTAQHSPQDSARQAGAKEGWAERKMGSKNKQDSGRVWEEMMSGEQGGFRIQLKRWQNSRERGNKGIAKETEQRSLWTVRQRYTSKVVKEGKNWQGGKERDELKMIRKVREKNKNKPGVAWLLEKIWRGQRVQQGLWGKQNTATKKTPTN